MNTPDWEALPKLVRDNIPQIIRDNEHREPQTQIIATDREFDAWLRRKAVEEAHELQEGPKEKLAEEIADVYEVIEALMKLHNLNQADVLEIKTKKRQERGGFKDRILLM